MESYSVKAILSVYDKSFTSGMNKALSTIENVVKRTNKAAGSVNKLTTSFKSTAAAIGVMQVASKAVDMLAGSLDGAISRYDTLNRFPKVLQQIGFSASDSKQSIKELSKGIQGLPTTLDDVAATTQRIATMTGDLKKATKTTLALNDAFLASGASTEDASRGLTQYIQMLSKGTVDLQSWRSLQETMGVALNDVAKAFGFAGASAQNDLYKALQDGSITFDQFNDKLIELDGGVNGFASRAKTASDGIATAMTNVRTAVIKGMTGIIEAIDNVLASNGLPTIQTSIERIGTAAESALDGVSQFISLFQKTEDPAKNLQNMQKAIESIAPIMAVVGAGAGLAGMLPVVDAIGDGFTEASQKGEQMAGSLTKAKDKALLFGKALKGGVDPGSESFKKLNWQSKLFVERVTGVKQILKGSFDPDSAGFSKFNKSSKEFLLNLDRIKKKTVDTRTTLKNFSKTVGETIKGIPGKAWNILPDNTKEKLTEVSDIISGTVIQAQNQFSKLRKSFTDAFSKEFSKGKSKIIQLGDSLGELSFKFGAMTGRFSKDAPLAWKAFDGLKTKLNGIPQMFDGIKSKVETFIPVFEKVGAGVGKGLKLGAETGMSAFNKMIAALGSVFKAAMLSVGPAAILGLVVVGLGLVNQEFGTEINKILTMVQKKGPEIITTLANGIVSKIPELANTGSVLLSQILTTIAGLLPSITTAGLNILNALIGGVTSNMDVILQGVISLIGSIATSIVQLAPNIMMAGLTILQSLIQGILNNMPTIILGIQGLFAQISTAIQTYLLLMITKGTEILQNLATGISQMLPVIIRSAIETVTKFVSTLSSNADKILSSGVEITKTVVQGITKKLPDILKSAVKLIVTIVEGIGSNLPQILQSGIEIIGELIAGLIKAIPDLLGAAVDLVGQLGRNFLDTDWASVGKDIISGIAKGISGAAEALWRAAKSALGSFKDKVLGFFGIHSPSRWGIYVGKMVDYGVVKGLDKFGGKIGQQAQGIKMLMERELDDMARGTFSFHPQPEFAYSSSSVVEYRDRQIGSSGGGNGRIYHIDNTIEIDGKQVAKSTAVYTQKELEKLEKRNNRKLGIR